MLAGAIGSPAEVEIGLSVLRAFFKANWTVHQFSQPRRQFGKARYLQPALLQIFSEVPESILGLAQHVNHRFRRFGVGVVTIVPDHDSVVLRPLATHPAGGEGPHRVAPTLRGI